MGALSETSRLGGYPISYSNMCNTILLPCKKQLLRVNDILGITLEKIWIISWPIFGLV